MEYNRLKQLPKDILIKMLFDIEKEAKQELMKQLLEDDSEFVYLKMLKHLDDFKDVSKNIIQVVREIIKTCIYKLDSCLIENKLFSVKMSDLEKCYCVHVYDKNISVYSEKLYIDKRFNTIEEFTEWVDKHSIFR